MYVKYIENAYRKPEKLYCKIPIFVIYYYGMSDSLRKELYMGYRINPDLWKGVFAVPNEIVDGYIKLASESRLKILLCLLRYSEVDLSLEQLSELTGIDNTADIEDSLLFWENRGVISKNGAEFSPVTLTAQKPSLSDEAAAARAHLKSETVFPPKEIASAIKGDKAVKYLFGVFEELAGRPTKHAERNTLMILIDEIQLPCEVAVMLVRYCFSIDKPSPSYMKSVALDWYNNGIDTLDKAEERIKYLSDKIHFENKLKKKFGMTSAFSARQKEMIEEWSKLGLSDSLFDAAYDATLNGTGKLSFPYMDKILRKWHSEGITDPSMLQNKKKSDTASEESSFSISDIEQTAYGRYSKK